MKLKNMFGCSMFLIMIDNQDLRDQNYHAFTLKNEQYLESTDYNSRNTNQLNVDEIIDLLKKSKMDI